MTTRRAIAQWWRGLSERERILAALEAREAGLITDTAVYVAEKPWKYIVEAYAHSRSREAQEVKA